MTDSKRQLILNYCMSTFGPWLSKKYGFSTLSDQND